MWIIGAVVLAVLGIICWIAYEADQARKRKQQEALAASQQAELERRARVADNQSKTVGGSARVTRLDQLPTPQRENIREDSFGQGLVEWSEEQARRREIDAAAATLYVDPTVTTPGPDPEAVAEYLGRLEAAVVEPQSAALQTYAESFDAVGGSSHGFGGGSSAGGGASGSWGGSDSSSSSSDSSSSSSDGGGGGGGD